MTTQAVRDARREKGLCENCGRDPHHPNCIKVYQEAKSKNKETKK